VVSQFIGPPIGGVLLLLDGIGGIAGWQWLFIIEALPAVIMCVVLWNLLTDRPSDAAWLRPDQKAWLTERLDQERAQREAIRKYSLGETFSSPKMWLLTLTYFGHQVAGYGLVFFLPLIVQGLGVSKNWIGPVSALPNLCAFVAMICWGYHSDRTGERTWHVAGALLLAAAGLSAGTLIGVSHPALTMLALCLAVMGSQSVGPVFYSLPTAMLTGTAAAGGIAMINSIGNLGGWLGPWVYGLVKDATGSTNTGLLCLALGPIIAAIAVVAAGHDRRLEHMPSRR
jgi:nitrate/nitrite transporter NarK